VLVDLIEHASQQHILTKPVKVEELFAESVRGLVG
jgi:4,5-dihydroxyphthalate decarboxylase